MIMASNSAITVSRATNTYVAHVGMVLSPDDCEEGGGTIICISSSGPDIGSMLMKSAGASISVGSGSDSGSGVGSEGTDSVVKVPTTLQAL